MVKITSADAHIINIYSSGLSLDVLKKLTPEELDLVIQARAIEHFDGAAINPVKYDEAVASKTLDQIESLINKLKAAEEGEDFESGSKIINLLYAALKVISLVVTGNRALLAEKRVNLSVGDVIDNRRAKIAEYSERIKDLKSSLRAMGHPSKLKGAKKAEFRSQFNLLKTLVAKRAVIQIDLSEIEKRFGSVAVTTHARLERFSDDEREFSSFTGFNSIQ